MKSLELMEGIAALPDSATVGLLAALNEANGGNLDAVPGLLENAARNMRHEGYGDDDDGDDK